MHESPVPDEHLVSLSKDGSLDAFNTLVSSYERQVYNLCLRLVGDQETAEDVTQEAFIAAFRGIRGFRGGSFRSWLLRIAANQAKDELRRGRRRPATVVLTGPDDESEVDFPDHTTGPEEQSENMELAEGLRIGLSGLSFEQRQVVILIEYVGLDYAEAAESTGVSVGTVKSRLHRGRDGLRQFVVAHPELFGTRWRQDE